MRPVPYTSVCIKSPKARVARARNTPDKRTAESATIVPTTPATAIAAMIAKSHGQPWSAASRANVVAPIAANAIWHNDTRLPVLSRRPSDRNSTTNTSVVVYSLIEKPTWLGMMTIAPANTTASAAFTKTGSRTSRSRAIGTDAAARARRRLGITNKAARRIRYGAATGRPRSQLGVMYRTSSDEITPTASPPAYAMGNDVNIASAAAANDGI